MKPDYMTRLSRAARWALPRTEADSVLEDYQEMLRENPRSEEVLYRELGRPGQAVRLLLQPRSYRHWLLVFLLLTVCLLLPPSAVFIRGISELFRNLRFPLAGTLQILGTAGAFVWFQREGAREKNRALPKGLLPLLLLPALGAAAAWTVAWWTLTEHVELFFRLRELSNGAFGGNTIRTFFVFEMFALFLLGAFGLVQARIGDRRWRALFVFCLAASFLTLQVLLRLTSMNISTVEVPYFWDQDLVKYLWITVFGLIGTGVSLC